MGLIQMNGGEGPVMPAGSAELTQHMQDEQQQKMRGGVTGEGQELSAEDESRINEGIGDENVDGGTQVLKIENHISQVGLVRKSATATQQQTHHQEPLVRWERFLPVRSLKVLLVENDDSSRQVVTALLRNCDYEVVAVANGLQAWKILEDLTANIDLVLTEVVLPCLTGISLLSRIMSHKTRKNIPVIMMSSHNSMSIVFKCLSKGAVDFLVKPIRKNELKNLWQHVWRKSHSSSGSGSGEHSDNKHDDYDEDDIGSIGLNARDRSDNGSGTQQSSWTKMATEVDSPRSMSPWDRLGDPPGSTCAQVNDSMTKPVRSNQDCEKQDDHLALKMVTDIVLEIGAPAKAPTLQPQGQWEEVPSNLSECNEHKSSEKVKVDEEQEKAKVELNFTERPNGECKNVAPDATGSANNTDISLLEIQVLDNPSCKVSNLKDNSNHGHKEVPSSFELSSKSLNGVADIRSSTQDQNILRHSDRSAFSRYNSAYHQAPTGNVGSCSPIDNSSEAATGSMQGLLSYLNTMPPNHHSNGSNNINDIGSSTNNAFNKPFANIDKPTQKSTMKYLKSSSAFQPVQNASPQPAPQENEGKQHIQVQHHHHHYHHHHMHNMVAQQLVNRNDQSLQNKTTATSLHGSSNLLSAPINSDAGNQSLNGSASGSNHGSNAQVGSNVTLLGRTANMESDDRVTEKEGTTGGIQFETGNAPFRNCFAQREAALNKFRQKRKERCFEKKVRYQSRKKLAEQRPRVRGQFVRHAVEENKGNGTHQ